MTLKLSKHHSHFLQWQKQKHAFNMYNHIVLHIINGSTWLFILQTRKICSPVFLCTWTVFIGMAGL